VPGATQFARGDIVAEVIAAGTDAELARRFFHCYGPASAQHFADWTQRSLADAKNAFSLIQDELAQVTFDRKTTWLLRRDEDALASAPEPSGVRLLPVQAPYLQQRDRATLLEHEPSRRKLWQPVRGAGWRAGGR
jgi:hypothetical protein